MKNHPERWSDKDFEDMCWHDNRVHGFRFHNPREGYDYDLVVDIDYILEWIEENGRFRFMVAPCTLRFHGAHAIRFDLDINYRQCLDIDRIERQEASTDAERKVGYKKYLFEIYLHDQAVPIRLEASGFTQLLTGPPTLSDSQSLERKDAQQAAASNGDKRPS